MTPMQQILLGVGAKKKTYMEDVFSTDVWIGDAYVGSTPRTITSGINLSGDGGMLWIKNRGDSGEGHLIFDTERGSTKRIYTNNNGIELSGSPSGFLSSFTTSGYTIGQSDGVNKTNIDHVGWSFKKSKGFFDVVTYTGNGSNRTIAHSLGCVPGLIMIKNVSASENWRVYHRATKATHNLQLNDTDAAGASSTPFNNTEPTASVFSVGTDGATNNNGDTIVAYLFAGGESTAATARSVDYDGSDDNTVWQSLSGDNADDLTFGTGDFTVEGWVNPDTMVGATPTICDFRDQTAAYNTTSGFWLGGTNDGKLRMYTGGAFLDNPSEKKLFSGQWTHFAAVRSSGTIKIFINGIQYGSDVSNSTDFNNSNYRKMRIGASYTGGDLWNGKISNFRVTKGQALYTTAFKPSTEPLTTTSQGATASNVKLLCCNNSSTTGSTVTPVTPANNGSPTASTDSPFDDPAGFVFGENGDQNVIKCGSYTGNGSSTGPEIFLGDGWEPQWVMVKRTDSGGTSWVMLDTMRAWTAEGVLDAYMYANKSDAESTHQWGAPRSTGMQMDGTDGTTNASGGSYIYLAIRRSDGYVGKPAEVGTDVFTMDTGNNSATIPCFDSGFPVDFALRKSTTAGWGTDDSKWRVIARLTQGKTLMTHVSDAEATDSNIPIFDSNVGISKGDASSFQAWMWKRHAGFDVVTDTSAEWVSHNLNRVPEMVIIKHRTVAENWFVWHKDFNGGGSNSIGYWVYLNGSSAESNAGNVCPIGNTLPTATHFQSDTDSAVRHADCIAFLFASVDGISKVGSYSGNGTGNSGGGTQTITTGFQPRFLIIKTLNVTGNWWVFDTTGGAWGSGFDQHLYLDGMDARFGGSVDSGEPTSTGFTVKHYMNTTNESYIYYAHA